ncbi:hypothetical protein ACLGI4_27760 [Streptomyces sp. HMX112]|uniref:hypothetical protein n=1 Tax=Streptomyces sp. HMX112 TaxID=3390850 RepID=UPI003A7F9BCF
MQSEHTPEPTESGLSTEDLAQPRDPGTSEGFGERSEPPAFPGEATGPGNTTGPEEDTTGFLTPERTAEDGTSRADTTSEDAAPGAPDTGETTSGTPAAGATASGDTGPGEGEAPQLLKTEDAESFRTRWQDIQNQFVDDPREAVHSADALVADVMQRLASTFADHKRELEGQWNQGEEANTEDLRMALRQYRSFFNRLLTT